MNSIYRRTTFRRTALALLCLFAMSSSTSCIKQKKENESAAAAEPAPSPAPGSGDALQEPQPSPRGGGDAEFSGYNIMNDPETCTEMAPGTICTQEFTEDDEFGANCRQAGYRAVQCTCHHWLCEVKIEEYRCGTIAGITCEDGKRCEITDTSRTDAAGICVPE